MSSTEASTTAQGTTAQGMTPHVTTTQSPMIPAPLSTAASPRPATPPSPSTPTQSPPTDPERRWRQAGRALLAKTIAEFTYEELLAPVPQEDGWHRLHLDAAGGGQGVEYRFR